jgi:glycosyltransferase involved in cell wall biosynthesis
MKISLLTGCNDKHYQLSLVSGLIPHKIEVDFIGNDDMQDADNFKNVNYLNLRGDQNPQAGISKKIRRISKYYLSLMKYAARSDSKVFHIQWLNKFTYFDRTLLNIYYKILGKKLVYTAHNIDDRERDGNNHLLNKLSLKFMYKIVDHIIVHTEKMKSQLTERFNIRDNKITVIRHGIHDAVYKSDLTSTQAREMLRLKPNHKVILFFGNILPYKGLEYLVSALVPIKEKYSDVRLIIAGRIQDKTYWKNIERIMDQNNLYDLIINKTQFIPDEVIEIYFKAADLSVLPYTYIFQSGILFVSYNFGLPVVATDVGSLREEIIEGKTGFMCKPEDPEDLAEKIDLYFQSDLCKNLEANRKEIIDYANEKYSWNKIGEKTYTVYLNLLNNHGS